MVGVWDTCVDACVDADVGACVGVDGCPDVDTASRSVSGWMISLGRPETGDSTLLVESPDL